MKVTLGLVLSRDLHLLWQLLRMDNLYLQVSGPLQFTAIRTMILQMRNGSTYFRAIFAQIKSAGLKREDLALCQCLSLKETQSKGWNLFALMMLTPLLKEI